VSIGEHPLLSYRFSIEILGIASSAVTGYFTELSGMQAEQDIIEYKVYHPITWHEQTVLIPGRRNTGEVTLKQGVTSDMGFWTWRWSMVHVAALFSESVVTINMYSPDGNTEARWHLFSAFPIKISGPEFNAGSNDYGVEELTIKYASMTREPLMEITNLSSLAQAFLFEW